MQFSVLSLGVLLWGVRFGEGGCCFVVLGDKVFLYRVFLPGVFFFFGDILHLAMQQLRKCIFPPCERLCSIEGKQV